MTLVAPWRRLSGLAYPELILDGLGEYCDVIAGDGGEWYIERIIGYPGDIGVIGGRGPITVGCGLVE